VVLSKGDEVEEATAKRLKGLHGTLKAIDRAVKGKRDPKRDPVSCLL